MIRTIRVPDVTEIAGPSLQPGMITIDGVILEVRKADGAFWLDHPNVNVYVAPHTSVQIYGRVTYDMVTAIKDTINEEKRGTGR